MLKFFYRLKRGRGMVLFVVIAVMTLLIAMATTAYFTASSSYKTVVSNYDSSQLYISTTSLADMIIGALTQSTSLAKTEGTTVTSSSETLLNDYSSLKSAVIASKSKALSEFGKKLPDLLNAYGGTEKDVNNLFVGEGSSESAKIQNLKTKSDALNKAFTEACAAADPVVGYSHNIYAKASSTNVNDFLQEAAKDPVAAGVCDGVKISIQLKNMDFEVESGKVTGRYKYYFDVNTTGFYRDNYVTVQDSIYNISGTSSGGGAPDFDAFFKSTGGSKKDGKGERAVVLGAEIVSDNAYFENSYTIFGELSGGGNKVYGGITATGSVFFTRGLECHIPAPGQQLKLNDDGKTYSFYPNPIPEDSTKNPCAETRHDWIIKGDLGLLNTDTELNLNGNDLYVDGDLIIGNQDHNTANRVFVNGNIYLLGDTSGITCNELYVGGKIIRKSAASINLDHYVEVTSDPNDKNKREIMTYAEAYPDGTNIKTGYTFLHYSWNTETAARRAWTTLQDELNFVYDKMKEACAEAGNTYKATKPDEDGDDATNGKLAGSVGKLYYTRDDWKGEKVTATAQEEKYNQYEFSNLQISAPKATGDHYEYKKSAKMTVSELFDEAEGATKSKDWPIYTATSETLNNVLMIDFTNLSMPTIGVTKGSEGGSPIGWLDGTPTTWKYNVDLPDGSTKEVEGSATLTYTNSKDSKTFQAVYTFPTSNGDGNATVTLQCGDYNNGIQAIFDLPYVEKGYQLDLKIPTSWNTQYNRLIKIRTGDNPPTGSTEKYSAMPIILRANYNDGGATLCDHDTVAPNGDSKKGDNAFSWWGSYNTSNDCRAMVELVDEAGTGSANGSVIFEMGNIDSTGNYNTLDKMADVVTYTVSQRDFVGTKNQLDDLGVLSSTDFSKESNVNKLMKTGSNKAVDFSDTKDYENRVMLVSNKKTNKLEYKTDYSGKVIEPKEIDPDKVKSGIVIKTTENLFCGYMYGPDTTFVNPDSSSNTVPVLGGLIVAEYIAGKNHYMYAEPNPEIVNSLFGALNSKDSKDKTPVEGYWYLAGEGTGKNYLG